mgnify:CR=1 FL=1
MIAFRFDLLAGFNEMEAGGFTTYISQFLSAYGENITEGGSQNAMTEFILKRVCKPLVTSLATEMCKDLTAELYDIGANVGPIQRVISTFELLSMSVIGTIVYLIAVDFSWYEESSMEWVESVFSVGRVGVWQTGADQTWLPEVLLD